MSKACLSVMFVLGTIVAVPVSALGASNSDVAQLCQKGGWTHLVRADGTPFANEGACTSYGSKGGKLGQTITFTSTSPSSVTALDPSYTPTATASSGLAVTITLDATSTGCSLAGGVVSFTAAGTCVIDANQAGNATWAAAPQKQQSITINRKPQTITFTSTNPSPVTALDSSYTPTATATSGLAVAITLDSASTGCSLSGGVVSFTAAGTCVIDANQAGNGTWAAASQVQQSITVDACISTDAQLRAAAAAGGSYCLAPSVPLTGGEVVVGSTLSLTSAGQTNATVDAQHNSRVFNVTLTGQLTLNNVTVTGGEIHGLGGGIYVDASFSVAGHGSVILNGQTSVTGNTGQDGGGVYLRPSFGQGGTLTMNDNARVSSNSANPLGDNITTAAGGVFVDQNAVLIMNGTSSVEANQVGGGAVSLGGGLLNNAGHITLNGSASIKNNLALVSSFPNESIGGGVYFVNGGSLALNDSSSITGNSAVNTGGGIYRIDNGSGTISGVTGTNVVGNTPNNCAGTTAVAGCAN